MDHDAIIRFLKCDEYVDRRLFEYSFKGFDPKLITNRYHKLKLLREMETKYNLSVWEASDMTEGEMDHDFYRLIKTHSLHI